MTLFALAQAPAFRPERMSVRNGLDRTEIETLEAQPKFCTMSASSAIMKLPPTEKMISAGFNKPKPPKLSDAYEHFFGKNLEGAHNALVDVRACKEVYFELLKRNAVEDSKNESAA